eukprot:TRINITY_DN3022_c0_g1_i2.p1 TRINITY_DN3022_c0_g1~~TRINITY_DN3022_c0_g1_i2.p1  ORF type:complete len:297 (+),score=84.62 TRINITY_DN3022_c0_g1_i2:124-1014(+)
MSGSKDDAMSYAVLSKNPAAILEAEASLEEGLVAWSNHSSGERAGANKVSAALESISKHSDPQAAPYVKAISDAFDALSQLNKERGQVCKQHIVAPLKNHSEKHSTAIKEQGLKYSKARDGYLKTSDKLSKKVMKAGKNINKAKETLGQVTQVKKKWDQDVARTEAMLANIAVTHERIVYEGFGVLLENELDYHRQAIRQLEHIRDGWRYIKGLAPHLKPRVREGVVLDDIHTTTGSGAGNHVDVYQGEQEYGEYEYGEYDEYGEYAEGDYAEGEYAEGGEYYEGGDQYYDEGYDQ